MTLSQPSDLELLHSVAARDRVAFEALYRRYHRRLFGFVGRWVRDPNLIEEIVDDVLFTVWTSAEKFEERSKVSTWIFGIAYRRTMVATRERPEERSLDNVAEPSAEDAALGAVVLRDALTRAMGDLSADHRAVITLTYFEGCSYAEIAKILACPVNTVKTRMFFARKQLRRSLVRGWGHPSIHRAEGGHGNG